MLMIIPILATCAARVAVPQVPGYTPYSWVPAMGNGSSPASQTVASMAFYNQTAWVTDKDEYQRIADHAIVQLANSATNVEYNFQSGRYISTNNVYDPDTGKRTFTFVLQAPSIASGTTWVKVDKFRGLDTGNIIAVKDAATDWSENAVTVTPVGG